MKHCTRCILPANYRNIRFNTEGVCNYCLTYENLKEQLTDFDMLRPLLEERFNGFKGRHPYDCLVGLSGGKDSSYVAMQLKKKHGLNVLAFTFDNGFLTDYAKENIEKVTRSLGIDHFFHSVNWELHQQFYKQAVKWFGTPCPGCSYAGYAFMHKAAFERQIPLVIHGRSRSQMFREILAGSPDAFLPFIKTNLVPYDRDLVLATTLKAKKKLEAFIKMSIREKDLRNRFYDEFFPNMEQYRNADAIPEFVGYFLYSSYCERTLMDDLEEGIPGWKSPAGKEILTHQDCAAHDAAAYLFRQAAGYPLLSFELSVLIREGSLSRKEALERLSREPDEKGVPEESLDYLCEKLTLNPEELPGIVGQAAARNRRRGKLLKWKNRLLRPKLDLFES